MSPLPGLRNIDSTRVPTSDDVGYCYVAPPGLRTRLQLKTSLYPVESETELVIEGEDFGAAAGEEARLAQEFRQASTRQL